MAAKKTKGRQKVEMKRIENEDDRLITFSKRRSGIYKKASELVTLTGAEIAFVVFSPAGKPFSFSHPSIELVVNRFLGEDPPDRDDTHPLVEAHRRMRIEELTQKYNEMQSQLDMNKERGMKMKEKLKGKETKGWWGAPVEELNCQELIELEKKFKELHMILNNQIMEINNGASSSHAPQISNSFALDSHEPINALSVPNENRYEHGKLY